LPLRFLELPLPALLGFGSPRQRLVREPESAPERGAMQPAKPVARSECIIDQRSRKVSDRLKDDLAGGTYHQIIITLLHVFHLGAGIFIGATPRDEAGAAISALNLNCEIAVGHGPLAMVNAKTR
jgi:hypothetical protein